MTKNEKPKALEITTLTVYIPVYIRDHIVDELRSLNQNMVISYVDDDGVLALIRTNEGSDLVEWGRASV